MKTIKKSLLKSGYYWEYKDFYDSLPSELAVPKYQTEVFTETITNKQILETYKIKPFSIEEAFAVVADYSEKIKKGEWKIIYFKDGTTTCRLLVYRHSDGRLEVYINEVNLDRKWGAGNGVLFSNETLESDNSLSLDNSESLTLESAIKICKENGLKITREKILIEEL